MTEMDSSRAIRYPCQCSDGECGCCSGNILSNFNINLQNKACVNVTYYPEDFEFHVRLLFNDVTFFQRKMSGMKTLTLTPSIRLSSTKGKRSIWQSESYTSICQSESLTRLGRPPKLCTVPCYEFCAQERIPDRCARQYRTSAW